jgi:DNA-binding MarR family transcriptional regulator
MSKINDMSNTPTDDETSPTAIYATSLIRQLFKANLEYAKALGEKLEVNPTDFKVMEYLMEHGPSSPGAIAGAVGVTAGALTQSLDRLEKVGHTKREHSLKDRRSINVVPNPKSVEAAWAGVLPLAETSIQTLESMTEGERLAVVRFLEQMTAVYARQTTLARR